MKRYFINGKEISEQEAKAIETIAHMKCERAYFEGRHITWEDAVQEAIDFKIEEHHGTRS